MAVCLYPDSPGLRAYALARGRPAAKAPRNKGFFKPSSLCSFAAKKRWLPAVVRSPARRPPLAWRCPGRSGLSLLVEFGSQVRLAYFPWGIWAYTKDSKGTKEMLSNLCGLRVLCVGHIPAPGVSARGHVLLSGSGIELRKPAEHKGGSPSRREGDPVQQANSHGRSSPRRHRGHGDSEGSRSVGPNRES